VCELLQCRNCSNAKPHQSYKTLCASQI